MEIKQLRIFVKVCEYMNFTHTAREMNYSQSTVSDNVISLERELGYKLFERLNRKLYLTRQGQVLLDQAQEILRIHDGVLKIKEEKKIIRVGITESLCSYKFPIFFREFLERHPHINIIFTIARCEEIPEFLRTHRIDVGFNLDEEIYYEDLITDVLFEEEIVFIKSSEYSEKEYTKVKDLDKENVVMSEGYSGYNKFFMDLYEHEGLNVGNYIYMESIEGIKSYVKGGFGISFMPLTTVEKDIAEKNLDLVRFDDTRYFHQVKLLYHKDKYITDELQALMAAVVEQYR